MSAPERVTVHSPRTHATRISRQWPVARDIDEQTELGAVYVRSLMRAQLMLAILTCTAVVIVVGGLPLLFATAPELARIRVLGVPLPWLVLACCVPPVWIAIAWWHVRQAERAESEFTDLVERS